MSPTQVESATRVTAHAHEGQAERIGAPNIQHPELVASFVQVLPDFVTGGQQLEPDALAAAWLHDGIEDTSETGESLTTACISHASRGAVVALARTPERVARLDEPIRVRLAARYDQTLQLLGVDGSVITALHASRAGR